MFHVFADAELASDATLAGRSGLVEPVFTGNIIGHKLVGKEAGDAGRETCGAVHAVGRRQGAEEGLEFVFLLSVEIYFEVLHILRGSESRLAVMGGEVVMIQGDVP